MSWRHSWTNYLHVLRTWVEITPLIAIPWQVGLLELELIVDYEQREGLAVQVQREFPATQSDDIEVDDEVTPASGAMQRNAPFRVWVVQGKFISQWPLGSTVDVFLGPV